jgi:hypothetical protein
MRVDRLSLNTLERTVLAGFIAGPFFAGAASAVEPWGEWLVKDKSAQIRIAEIGCGALWGVMAWKPIRASMRRTPIPPSARSRRMEYPSFWA